MAHSNAKRSELDDLIDGLKRAKNPPGFRVSDSSPSRPLSDGDRTTESLKPTGSGPSRAVKLAIAPVIGSVLLCVGFCTGASATPEPTTVTVPGDTVTVTVTETKEQALTQPASCTVAIEQAKRTIQKASTVAAANDKQLDIMSAAYQAIFEKDAEALNKASIRQRDLERELSSAAIPVLMAYQSIMDGLATCQGQ